MTRHFLSDLTPSSSLEQTSTANVTFDDMLSQHDLTDSASLEPQKNVDEDAFNKPAGPTMARSLSSSPPAATRAIVDEDGLPDGIPGGPNDVNGERHSTTGRLGYLIGADGQGGFRWFIDDLPELTSRGDTLSWRLADQGQSLVATSAGGHQVLLIELTDLTTGAYKVSLLDVLDHPHAGIEDDINFDIKYIVTDSDGATATSSLKIIVDDDTPIARSYTVSTESDTTIILDIFDQISFGADGPGKLTSTSIQGSDAVGTLTGTSSGIQAFTPNPDFTGTATINYTAEDADGDTVHGQIFVNVEKPNAIPLTPDSDGNPETRIPIAVVDEDALPGGVSGGINDVAGDKTSAIGELGYFYGNDGAATSNAFRWSTSNLPSLTSGGSNVAWTVDASGHTLLGYLDNGDHVLSVKLTDLSSGSYLVTLLRPLDHPRANIEDDIRIVAGYTITDIDGDSASGSLRILIDDDTPVATDDVTVTDVSQPIIIDVLANDSSGADGMGSILSASVQGGDRVGRVTINADSTLTFSANAEFIGQAVIDYSFVDRDGDSANAQSVIDVTNDNLGIPSTPDSDDDPSTTAPTALLDEDGLIGGIEGGIDDAPGRITTITGSLGYDYGADGAADQDAFHWNIDSLPSLTAGGTPLTFSVSADGRTL
ncbi:MULTISPECIES: Ig-like domain-containing protein, partial [unclassified Halomonas]|uniref:Ig-like domain-containing protein n=1 Tax=unclassified Halomonas TaxID=2609666 RepID=UPI001C94B094